MYACAFAACSTQVYKGVLYASQQPSDRMTDMFSCDIGRELFVEQLLTAMWVFKDFPDVDLFFNCADGPVTCTERVPFLQVQPGRFPGLILSSGPSLQPI